MEGTPTGEDSRELEMRAKFEERAMLMETANRFEITLKLRRSIHLLKLFLWKKMEVLLVERQSGFPKIFGFPNKCKKC